MKKRAKTSVHLSSSFFGVDKLQDISKVKSCCLTRSDYPTQEGFTNRTYILENEEIATDNESKIGLTAKLDQDYK